MDQPRLLVVGAALGRVRALLGRAVGPAGAQADDGAGARRLRRLDGVVRRRAVVRADRRAGRRLDAGALRRRALASTASWAAPRRPRCKAYVASRTAPADRTRALSLVASSFGLGTVIGPALAPLLVLPFVGLTGPFLVFAVIAIGALALLWTRLPSDEPRFPARGRAYDAPYGGGGHPHDTDAGDDAGDDGALPVDPPKLRWRDRRVAPWFAAGLLGGHAQAMVLGIAGFLVLDRLELRDDPMAGTGPIGLVLMAGGAGDAAGAMGANPRLPHGPARRDFVGRGACRAGRRAVRGRRGPPRHRARLCAGEPRLRAFSPGLHRRQLARRLARRAGPGGRQGREPQRRQLHLRAPRLGCGSTTRRSWSPGPSSSACASQSSRWGGAASPPTRKPDPPTGQRLQLQKTRNSGRPSREWLAERPQCSDTSSLAASALAPAATANAGSSATASDAQPERDYPAERRDRRHRRARNLRGRRRGERHQDADPAGRRAPIGDRHHGRPARGPVDPPARRGAPLRPRRQPRDRARATGTRSSSAARRPPPTSTSTACATTRSITAPSTTSSGSRC